MMNNLVKKKTSISQLIRKGLTIADVVLGGVMDEKSGWFSRAAGTLALCHVVENNYDLKR